MKKSKKDEGCSCDEWQPWIQRQTALQEIETRLATEDPRSVDLLFYRAELLMELGRTADAQNVYLNILAIDATHYGSLINLGRLLYSSGYKTAARTCYAEAVRLCPDKALGHLNLASVLRKNGELPEAYTHYTRALEITPDLPEAHQGLAHLLREMGEEEQAAFHRRLGYMNHSVVVWPYRGRTKPIPVVLLASAMGGNAPIHSFLDQHIYHITCIFVEYYNSHELPPHQLLINAIGDADLCASALQRAAVLSDSSKMPTINNPGAVFETGRIGNALRLDRIEGVKSPRMQHLPKTVLSSTDALSCIADRGFSFPFLVRSPGFHNGRHFYKVENLEELSKTLDRIPGRDVLMMEFLDGRDETNKIRKYRVMIVDGQLFPLHLAVGSHWKIHYSNADMADRPEHLAEERAFLENMNGVLGQKTMRALEGIRDALGLDYAGIDFSLDSRKEILLFEANSAMIVPPPENEENKAYRREPIERIASAIRNMFAKKVASCLS
jgi:tetratricopeptide (TPR) repeat protein